MMVPIFEGFSFDEDGLLRFKIFIYVPPNDEFRSLILSEDHRAFYMAHPRVTKMRVDLKTLFFWKGMKADIVIYVAKCLECQQVKAEHSHPIGLLQPHVVPELKWEVISMGFYCWIATNNKETRLDFHISRRSDEECSLYSCAYNVSVT
jgi:hypothetical protein